MNISFYQTEGALRGSHPIDLMMLCGHDFLPAVMILEGWLEQYRRELGQGETPVEFDSPAAAVS